MSDAMFFVSSDGLYQLDSDGVKNMTTPSPVIALTEAVWQVLDDMGVSGNSCCGYAKAKLRIAFEPFRDADENFDDWLSLAEAKHIVEHCDRGVEVPPFVRPSQSAGR